MTTKGMDREPIIFELTLSSFLKPFVRKSLVKFLNDVKMNNSFYALIVASLMSLIVAGVF